MNTEYASVPRGSYEGPWGPDTSKLSVHLGAGLGSKMNAFVLNQNGAKETHTEGLRDANNSTLPEIASPKFGVHLGAGLGPEMSTPFSAKTSANETPTEPFSGSFEAFSSQHYIVGNDAPYFYDAEAFSTRTLTQGNSDVWPRTEVSDFARCDPAIPTSKCFLETLDPISLLSKSVSSLCCESFRSCSSQQSFETPFMHVFLERWCTAFDYRCIVQYDWLSVCRFGEAENPGPLRIGSFNPGQLFNHEFHCD